MAEAPLLPPLPDDTVDFRLMSALGDASGCWLSTRGVAFCARVPLHRAEEGLARLTADGLVKHDPIRHLWRATDG